MEFLLGAAASLLYFRLQCVSKAKGDRGPTQSNLLNGVDKEARLTRQICPAVMGEVLITIEDVQVTVHDVDRNSNQNDFNQSVVLPSVKAPVPVQQSARSPIVSVEANGSPLIPPPGTSTQGKQLFAEQLEKGNLAQIETLGTQQSTVTFDLTKNAFSFMSGNQTDPVRSGVGDPRIAVRGRTSLNAPEEKQSLFSLFSGV